MGGVVLHMGLAGWVMYGTVPVVVPEQQVIQIAMVAPSQPLVKEAETEVPPSPVPLPPVVEQATKKAPVVKKEAKKRDHRRKKELAKKQTIPTQVTSGPQAQDAIVKRAAFTEPTFNAAYLNNPPPYYPEYARSRHIQGKVLLEVEVTMQGTAGKVLIAHSSGYSVLDKAAYNAVQDWRFVPARQGNEVVEATVLIPVEFILN